MHSDMTSVRCRRLSRSFPCRDLLLQVNSSKSATYERSPPASPPPPLGLLRSLAPHLFRIAVKEGCVQVTEAEDGGKPEHSLRIVGSRRWPREGGGVADGRRRPLRSRRAAVRRCFGLGKLKTPSTVERGMGQEAVMRCFGLGKLKTPSTVERGMGQDVHVYSNADVEDICGNFSPSNPWCVAAFSTLYSGGILPPSTKCVSRGFPTLCGPDSWRHHDADYLETTAGCTLLRHLNYRRRVKGSSDNLETVRISWTVFFDEILKMTEEELGTYTSVVSKSLSTVCSFISSLPVTGLYVHIYLKFLSSDITTPTYEFLESTSKQS